MSILYQNIKLVTYLVILMLPISGQAYSATVGPRFTVSKNHFVDNKYENKDFRLFGATYFYPNTGWAPKFWENFDTKRTETDFHNLKSFGFNAVRVILTYNNFFDEECRIRKKSLDKLGQLLDVANSEGIVVQVVGPEHWGGLPPWVTKEIVGDRKSVDALKCLWRELSLRFGSHPALFAFELKNEPFVAWNDPVLSKRWRDWLVMTYGSPDKIYQVFRETSDGKEGWARVPKTDGSESRRLQEYQLFRENIATEWVFEQVTSIKLSSPNSLITLGFHQGSVPIGLSRAERYSGFNIQLLSRYLDFLDIHVYPLADGIFYYKSEGSFQINLRLVQEILFEVSSLGKPLTLGEFGWFGGGDITLRGQKFSATQQDQSRWGSAVFASSASIASGWFNWPMYDDPSASDVSQLSGLMTKNGTIKIWGKSLSNFAKGSLPENGKVAKSKFLPINWKMCTVFPSDPLCHQYR